MAESPVTDFAVHDRAPPVSLPAGYEARWQLSPQPRLRLGTRVHGETVWLGLAAGVLMTDASSVLLALVGGAGVLALGGAYLIERRINRPLRQLIGALMLAGISHDPRTPLTKLRFALEYVGPHCEPEMRQLMARNIEAADRIIDQFIDVARPGGEEALWEVARNTLVGNIAGHYGQSRSVTT